MSSGQHSYTYDAQDHRVRVDTQSGSTEFLFDPFGRRQSSWVVGSNAGNAGRVYWDGGLLANRSQNGGTYFHHTNYLGTERMRTDWNGHATSSYASGPFGEGQGNGSGTDTNQDPAGFTGQDHDTETGTDHFQYRQYSEMAGRWLSPDPYDGSYDAGNPQSLNRYAYVLSVPLSLTDPDGTDPCDVTNPSSNCTETVVCPSVEPTCNVGFGPSSYLGFGPGGIQTSYGGGGAGPAKTPPPAPNKSTCKTGFGFGVQGGADTALGAGKGTSGTGGVGAGVFSAGQAGVFASGGIAQSVRGVNGMPQQNLGNPASVGGGAGVGGGVFVTNAAHSSQLKGPFLTIGGAAAVGIGLSVQISVGTDNAGNHIWQGNLSFIGTGFGAYAYKLATNTAITSVKGDPCDGE